ncbi:MAG: Ig-like domain-containing protein [Actinomycetota bacterium]|nr:Ig-like domain-containing protein [Actinomycetota bacterium]
MTTVAMGNVAGSALPASAALRSVTVTCDVPKSQPERQLAPNSCLNYLPDGTQTYTALVRNGNGQPVAGVKVVWSESDAKDAHFRVNQTPCYTNSAGTCSAEVKDTAPRSGERVTVKAHSSGYVGTGYLTFR